MSSRQPPVLAAGALCWRVLDGKLRVLVVHRSSRGDISLPKGKLDDHEGLPAAAVREVAEETGLRITLGAHLADTSYTLPGGRAKMVRYWAARVDEDATAQFSPNSEVSGIEWLSVKKARARLSYEHDVDVLEEFVRRHESGLTDTFALIAVRHGKAVPHAGWSGPDSERPLQLRGELQSVALAPMIAAYGPLRIISSTAVRCVTTIAPLGELLAMPVEQTPLISQDAHELGEAGVRAVIDERLSEAVPAVLCSHGPVLPDIMREIARAAGSPIDGALRRAGMLDTGSFSVVHLTRESAPRIAAIETHSAQP